MNELSVIIPTFNRAEMLAEVLDGLARQTTAPGVFEIIVLDDGSTDATAATVKTQMATTPELRYIYQDNAGLNTARNHGAAVARAPLLAYLDDDVLLPENYVEQMLAAFRSHSDCDAVAGRVVLRFEGNVPSWLGPNLRLYLSEYDRGESEEVLEKPEYPRGANFGIRRSSLDGLGGFVPTLDRRGTSLISSGEQELFMRLHAENGVIIYWPSACVQHRVPPERLTLDYFRRRARAQGASDALLTGAHRRPSDLVREVARVGRVVPIAGRSLLKRSGSVNVQLWWQYSLGRLAATWKASP